MSFSQSVRLTVRLHAGDFKKEADLALPVSSSLGELMAELVDFIGAPESTVPWRATTPAGRPVDQLAPLSHTQLADGSLLVISPAEDLPAPVIRDSAESLVFAGHEGSTRGILTMWVTAALLCLAVVVGSVASDIPSGAVAAGACAVVMGGLILAVWHRGLSLAWLLITAGALAAGAVVAGWPIVDEHSLRLGFFASAVGATVMALVCHVLAIAHPRTTGAAATISLLLLVAGLTLPGSAGAVIGISVVLVAFAPGISTMMAGLRVPQLPTAGQDLDISDEQAPDIDDRSRRAHFLYEGICFAIALMAAMALGYLALTSTPRLIVTVMLCLTLCAAVLLHGARHRQAHALWSLMALAVIAAVAAPIAVVVASAHGPIHPSLWIAACFPIFAALPSPWWSPLVQRATPTTIQWFERLEAIALVATLPLAAHVAGLFEFIRGLG
ncbi:type VII secretion integral membrane protein EccD [Corynebacterium sp. L4756]|uniref:type VII secretion integral membrane protein EccD n=1 Tax=unclassified Corynebacterium TaxID=2624378 RepID=UPI00374D38A9